MKTRRQAPPVLVDGLLVMVSAEEDEADAALADLTPEAAQAGTG